MEATAPSYLELEDSHKTRCLGQFIKPENIMVVVEVETYQEASTVDLELAFMEGKYTTVTHLELQNLKGNQYLVVDGEIEAIVHYNFDFVLFEYIFVLPMEEQVLPNLALVSFSQISFNFGYFIHHYLENLFN